MVRIDRRGVIFAVAATVLVTVAPTELAAQVEAPSLPDRPPAPPPAPPRASLTDAPGAALGFRVAWGFPFGGIGYVRPADARSLALGDVVTNALALGPELGVATDSLRATAFAELGWLGSRPSALGCGTTPVPAGTAAPECGASLVRVGVSIERALPDATGPWRPWYGGGVGYEWLSLRGADPNPLGAPTQRTIGGFELLRLAAGADRGGRNPRLGPFVALSLGRYHSGAVARPELHAWLLFGLRFAFTSPVGRLP